MMAAGLAAAAASAGEPVWRTAGEPWAEGLGSQRAVIRVREDAPAAEFTLRWRRPDADVGAHEFRIVPAGGGAPRPVRRVAVNGEEATVRFAPSGAGLYYFYYLPYTPEYRHGGFGGRYLPPERPGAVTGRCVRAEAEAIECRTARDSFWPMEVCATAAEAGAYRERNPARLLLFPEDRMRPIRLRRAIPRAWLGAVQGAGFRGAARANEYYCFQIGVWNTGGAPAALEAEWRLPFPATCFNTEGVDARGRAFTRKVTVAPGRVQALWFGVDVPADAGPGEFRGAVTVRGGGETHSVPVTLAVAGGAPLDDRGDSDPCRMTRLRWLNSRIGQETEAPPEAAGLPEGMAAAAAPGVTVTARTRTERPDGEQVVRIELRAERACRDARFTWKLTRPAAASPFFMGLGEPARKLPAGLVRRWGGGDPMYRPWDSCWIGGAAEGLFLEFRGAAYTGPLLNLYRPAAPETWGRGEFRVAVEKGRAALSFTSDPLPLAAGETRVFTLAALPTPQHRLDFRAQFTRRYFHAPEPSETDYRDAGVKIVNVHHANRWNPVINYPFLTAGRIRERAADVHRHGARLKIYYTIRELTSALPELWALRSLGNEIFAAGPGGGFPWLREHLREGYRTQWYAPLQKVLPEVTADAALLTSPRESRWLNYYAEGLNWLVRNAGIDGIYLDDVMFDRPMARRLRRILDAAKPGCMIDLHSNTGFSHGPAMQYAGFFPYIDKLWFGESFRYDRMTPEQWLVEASGIPFGLTADMLQDGGNRWLGMQYGMTPRLRGNRDRAPRPVWKLWDEFGIADAEVLGWWDPACPVRPDRPAVKATAYRRPGGRMLVSIGNYSDAEESVKLVFSRPMRFLSAPDVEGFQKDAAPGPDGRWRLPPRRGLLLLFAPRE